MNTINLNYNKKIIAFKKITLKIKIIKIKKEHIWD